MQLKEDDFRVGRFRIQDPIIFQTLNIFFFDFVPRPYSSLWWQYSILSTEENTKFSWLFSLNKNERVCKQTTKKRLCQRLRIECILNVHHFDCVTKTLSWNAEVSLSKNQPSYIKQAYLRPFFWVDFDPKPLVNHNALYQFLGPFHSWIQPGIRA